MSVPVPRALPLPVVLRDLTDDALAHRTATCVETHGTHAALFHRLRRSALEVNGVFSEEQIHEVEGVLRGEIDDVVIPVIKAILVDRNPQALQAEGRGRPNTVVDIVSTDPADRLYAEIRKLADCLYVQDDVAHLDEFKRRRILNVLIAVRSFQKTLGESILSALRNRRRR